MFIHERKHEEQHENGTTTTKVAQQQHPSPQHFMKRKRQKSHKRSHNHNVMQIIYEQHKHPIYVNTITTNTTTSHKGGNEQQQHQPTSGNMRQQQQNIVVENKQQQDCNIEAATTTTRPPDENEKQQHTGLNRKMVKAGRKKVSHRPKHAQIDEGKSESRSKSKIQTTLMSSEKNLSLCTTLLENAARPRPREGLKKKGKGGFSKIFHPANNRPIRRQNDCDKIDQQTRDRTILSYFKTVTTNPSND